MGSEINFAEIFKTKKTGKAEFLTASEQAYLVDLKKEFEEELKNQQPVEIPPKFEKKTDELDYELKQAETRASRDGLTKLENRRGLFKRGTELFNDAERGLGEKSLSVMSLDIDFFKAYNEISHTFGDLALQTVAHALHSFSRDSGFSVRLGGEEIFLVVEKELSEAETQAQAEKLKTLINDSLNDLFSLLDEKKGRPGLTKDYLESRILNESRNRKSFNEEMATRPIFATVKEKARHLGLAVTEEMEPAAFVVALIEKANAVPFREAAVWLDLKKELGFDIGTVTVGAARVDLAESPVTEEEDQDFRRLVTEKFHDSAQGELLAQRASGLNFVDLVEMLRRSMVELNPIDSQTVENFIVQMQSRRFGRIVDLANGLAEAQKKIARNSLGVKAITMAELNKEKSRLVDSQVGAIYTETREKLARHQEAEFIAAREKRTLPVKDDLTRLLSEEKTSSLSSEDKEIYFQRALEIQQGRYFDPLTMTKNYEYLVKVVPTELAEMTRQGADYALVSFDVDNLKAINDTWGHKLGDVALMTVSLVMQEGLEKIPTELKRKMTGTGFEPAIIRATGGEEFIATFPGLSSEEAKEVFAGMNRRLGETLRSLTERRVPEEFKQDPKTKSSYDTYEAKIKEFIAKLPLSSEEVEYPRSEDEIAKFGTVTAGIISLAEVGDYLLENGRPNAGKMRQLADQIGERLKKEVHVENGVATSGRGEIWGLEAYYLAVKLDQLAEKLADAEKENQALAAENAELKKQIAASRRELKNSADSGAMARAREIIENS